MSRQLKKQITKIDYSQGQSEKRQSVQSGKGETTTRGASESSGKQVSAGTSTQISESIRNITSENRRANTTEEKANIGFEISFKVKIVGKIPNLKNYQPSNC